MFVQRFKLRPPEMLAAWVERPDVERLITETVRVAAVSAGAGYGKTVATARQFDAWPGPKSWYSLDASDADLGVFATYLDAMLAEVGAGRAFEGEPWNLKNPREIGALFAQPLNALGAPPLLVFDDVHLLEGSPAAQALGELIKRATHG